MKKKLGTKLLSMAIVGSLVIGSTTSLTGCTTGKDKPITLTVFSMLASSAGDQSGWGGDILLDKFNVKLNIVPASEGNFETRMEDRSLGDIIIFSKDSDQYAQALTLGKLYNWEDDNLLKEYGPYISKNMPYALEKNRQLTKKITKGKSEALYGFGHNVATSTKDHESFFYSWDLRWDLYKKLGYPKIKNLDDYHKVLKKMQKICPKDDAGNKTYAVSLWPDWDDSMAMYVKASATAYYGYDELGLGLYDPDTGTLHDALEKNGPYIKMLKFYNDLYQDNLLDPDSMTQTCDQMGEKVACGGTLSSIFNFSGSLQYNTDEHKEQGKLMASVMPEDATTIAYGMNPQGGDRVWTIGAQSQYPDLAMEVINYFSTPEGYMTYCYGPKGECWNYDKDGNTYFTKLGKACNANVKTKMGNGHKGTYNDGRFQFNNTTWSYDATNPDSNGETYNSTNWKSNNDKTKYKIIQDWRDKTKSITLNDYMEQRNYKLSPGSSYSASSKSAELKTTWSQVTNCLKTQSWNAIYAKSDAEFYSVIDKMTKQAKSYGYDKTLKWTQNEAKIRKSIEDKLD